MKNERNLNEAIPNFLEESSKLNKVLQKNYSVDDDCIFEYKKAEGGSVEIKNENKQQLESFKKKAFGQEGEIMKLIKYYEETNYDKMKDELQTLEHMAK